MANFIDLVNQISWDEVSPKEWATEIPQALIDVYSDPSQNREKIEWLRIYIAYNSGVYETTAKAVPLLLNALKENTRQDKSWIIELLGIVSFELLLDDPLYFSIYQEIYNEKDTIYQYLDGHNITTARLFAISIFSRFTLHADVSIRIFLTMLKVERDIEVALAIMDGINCLILNNRIFTENDLRRILLDLNQLELRKVDAVCLRIVSIDLLVTKVITDEQLNTIETCLLDLSSRIGQDIYKINTMFYLLSSIQSLVRTDQKVVLRRLSQLELGDLILRMITKELKFRLLEIP